MVSRKSIIDTPKEFNALFPILAITRAQSKIAQEVQHSVTRNFTDEDTLSLSNGHKNERKRTFNQTVLESEEEGDQEEDLSSSSPISDSHNTGAHSSVQLESLSLSSDNRFPSITAIKTAQAQEPLLVSIRKYLNKEKGWQTLEANVRLEASRCILRNDILYVWVLEQRSARLHRKEARIWIPPIMIPIIIALGHDIPLSGHTDIQRTFSRVSSTFWWPNMWQDVSQYIVTCTSCQFNKVSRLQRKGMIHEGFTPTYPFQYVSMDVTELPRNDNVLIHLLVFIDLFTRWVEIQVFEHAPCAEEVANAFLSLVVARHGTPEFLVSDNGSNLTAMLVSDVCRHLQTQRIKTSPYSPQTYGAIERFNRKFKGILSTLLVDQKRDWLAFLPHVLHAYRTSYHAALQDSPFFLLYGRDPRSPEGIVDNSLFGVDTQSFRTTLIERTQYARTMVLNSLAKASLKARQTFNKTAKPNTPLEGLVLKAVQENMGDRSVPLKLRNKFDGPYRIIRQVRPLTYDIQKLGTQEIVRAHQRTLKPFYTRTATLIPEEHNGDTDPSEPVFEVAKIMNTKWDPVLQESVYLVRWKGYTKANDTWEPLSSLTSHAKETIIDFLQSLSKNLSNTPRKKARS